MTDRPDWIEERLQSNPQNKLSQTHVVDIMLAADRPFFSITQLKTRIKPDVDRETIRNRLDELREQEIVREEPYQQKLYYIDYPESKWPLSPTDRQILAGVPRIGTINPFELYTFRDGRLTDIAVRSGLYLSIGLFFLGGFMSALDVPGPITTDHELITAAMTLIAFVLLLAFVQMLVDRIRNAIQLAPLGESSTDN